MASAGLHSDKSASSMARLGLVHVDPSELPVTSTGSDPGAEELEYKSPWATSPRASVLPSFSAHLGLTSQQTPSLCTCKFMDIATDHRTLFSHSKTIPMVSSGMARLVLAIGLGAVAAHAAAMGIRVVHSPAKGFTVGEMSWTGPIEKHGENMTFYGTAEVSRSLVPNWNSNTDTLRSKSSTRSTS